MNDSLTNNIICHNCGEINTPSTKFCIRCGTSLQPSAINEIQNTTNTGINIMGNGQNYNYMNQNRVQQPIPQQNYNTANQNVFQKPGMQHDYNISDQNGAQQLTPHQDYNNGFHLKKSVGSLNYFSYILGTILKPFDKFKSEEEKLCEVKNASLLSLIVIAGWTIMSLITTMLSAVRVKSYWSDEVEWIWENLKQIKYFKIIGLSLMIYTVILILISGVYFLASLVIKKDSKFTKLLGATATAFIPFAVCSSVLSSLLSMIYTPLGICITVIGAVYTLVILLELTNEIINIENKNDRIYFHLACLSIIFIVGSLILYKLALGALTSGLGTLENIFK